MRFDDTGKQHLAARVRDAGRRGRAALLGVPLLTVVVACSVAPEASAQTELRFGVQLAGAGKVEVFWSSCGTSVGCPGTTPTAVTPPIGVCISPADTPETVPAGQQPNGEPCNFRVDAPPPNQWGAIHFRATPIQGWEFTGRWGGTWTEGNCVAEPPGCRLIGGRLDHGVSHALDVDAQFDDVVAPETAITSGLDLVTADPEGRHTFAFASSDPTVGSNGTFQCRIDGDRAGGGDWTPCASPWNEPVNRGTHRFEVRAVDPSGNADATPAAWDWFQQRPPETAILDGPAEGAVVASTSARFRLGPDDASFSCKLDDGGWSPCSATPEFAELSEGLHTLQARAGNTFGEQDPTPAQRSWIVTAPSPGQPSPPPPTSPRPPASPPDPAKWFTASLTRTMWIPPQLRRQRASVCRGEIQATLRRGRTRLAIKSVRLNRRCRYTVSFRVAEPRLRGARTVTIRVRFLGNDYLAATKPKSYRVKVRAARQ